MALIIYLKKLFNVVVVISYQTSAKPAIRYSLCFI